MGAVGHLFLQLFGITAEALLRVSQRVLSFFLLGDITINARNTDDAAARIEDGRKGQRNEEAFAGFGDTFGLKRLHPFVATHLLEQLGKLLMPLGGDDH